MSGKHVPLKEMLRQGNYEAFLGSVMYLCQFWSRIMESMTAKCQVAQQLLAEMTSREGAPVDKLEALAVRFEAMRLSCVTARRDLCLLVWFDDAYQPALDYDKAAKLETVNRQRWQPFNEAAWDHFFRQMLAAVEPAVPLLDTIEGALQEMGALRPVVKDELSDRIREFTIAVFLNLMTKLNFLRHLNLDEVKTLIVWPVS